MDLLPAPGIKSAALPEANDVHILIGLAPVFEVVSIVWFGRLFIASHRLFAIRITMIKSTIE